VADIWNLKTLAPLSLEFQGDEREREFSSKTEERERKRETERKLLSMVEPYLTSSILSFPLLLFSKQK